MIYVTGDTHANIDIAKLNTTRFPQQKELTKNDFVIICGDFGLCWDGSHREMWWQDWLTAKNFTTLWIDVITHCAPRSIQTLLASWYENDPMVSFLDRVCSDLTFKRWFFGHYHVDKQVNEQFIALYNKVIPMEW